MTARICGKVKRVPVHPSVVIGGATVDVCQNKCLPEMTVCEEHASPDAVRMLVTMLVKQRDDALLCALVESGNFVEARRELDDEREEVARLKDALEERWADCHDGSEQGCCKSHE